MDLPLPVVEKTQERLIIRLPRRVSGGFGFLLVFPLAAVFLLGPALIGIGVFFPSLLHLGKPTFHGPFLAESIGYVIAALFVGVFCVAGGLLIYSNILGRFGHGEIHLWRGRIRKYERLGILRLWSTHPIDTLIRLNVEPADYQSKSNRQNEMDLRAFFSDAMPSRLAHNYNREQLLAAATELQSALPLLGAPAVVVIAGPPPLVRRSGQTPGAAAPQPTLAPPPRGTSIKIERLPEAGVQFTVPGYRWWVALPIALFVIPCATYWLIKPSDPKASHNLEMLFPHSQKGTVDAVVIALILVATLAAAYRMTRDVILVATARELTMQTKGLLGTKIRKWAAADIDRLEVENRTVSAGKGGSRTVRSLTLVPKKGWRQRYFKRRSEEEQRWLKAELSAAIWPGGPSAAELSAAMSPGGPSVTEAARKEPAATAKVVRAPRWFGVFFAAFACIVVVVGWWLAIDQDYRLRHGQLVQATVSRLQMVRHHGRRASTYYAPEIQYQYQAAGTWHASTDLFPSNMSGSEEDDLRDALFASLHEHSTIPAWYMDDEPSKAYLIHEHLFSPYAFILFADLFLFVGLVLALPPKSLAKSGVDLAESHRRRTITFIWLIVGVPAIGHYLLQWPAHWRADFLVATLIWVIISLGVIVWWRAAPMAASAPASTE